MRPGRYLPAMAALLFGMIAVPAHAATIQITTTDLVFAPAEVSAKVGDTIEWINKDVFVHTATARNGDFDVNMPPKKTVTSVLNEGRHRRILLPVPSEHEGGADDRALATSAFAIADGSGRPDRLEELVDLELEAAAFDR